MPTVTNMLRRNFTQIPNALICDNSISRDARLLYCFLASKPETWKFYNAQVQQGLAIRSAGAMAKYWRELLESGWISRKRFVNEKGKICGGFDYILNIEPINPAKSPNIETPESPNIEPTKSPNVEGKSLNAQILTLGKTVGHSNTVVKRSNNIYITTSAQPTAAKKAAAGCSLLPPKENGKDNGLADTAGLASGAVAVAGERPELGGGGLGVGLPVARKLTALQEFANEVLENFEDEMDKVQRGIWFKRNCRCLTDILNFCHKDKELALLLIQSCVEKLDAAGLTGGYEAVCRHLPEYYALAKKKQEQKLGQKLGQKWQG